MNDYKVNDIVKCMVTSIEGYGFFVTTDSGYSGLVHISEISEGYVKDIENYVKLGDTVSCKILEIDSNSHQLKLSIKNINYKKLTRSNLDESHNEFLSLQKMLPKWIEEKLKEYK